LATDVPLTEDVVAWYAQRMRIEQGFRDAKSQLGREREYTRNPGERLHGLLVELMIVLGRQMWQGRRALQASPTGSAGAPAAPTARPRDRVASDGRRGWHVFLTELVLGDGLVRETILASAAKSRRMQERPQVLERRVAMPTKNRSRTRATTQKGHCKAA
jgi:hypothetical protein